MNSDQRVTADPASDRKRIGVWENEGGGLEELVEEPFVESSTSRVVPGS